MKTNPLKLISIFQVFVPFRKSIQFHRLTKFIK